MVDFKQVNAADNPQEKSELVGTSNLADVLKEHGAIRGSWFLNGHEFRDFSADSPRGVATAINAATGKHGLVASIDDGFHLVLESDGPGDISVASGGGADKDRREQAQRHRDSGKGDADRAYAEHQFRRDESDREGKPDVLEMLGLEATADDAKARGSADWAAGESAEQRKERRERETTGGLRQSPNQRTGAVGGGGGRPNDAGPQSRRGPEGVSQGSGMNMGASDTQSADPHQRDGAGSLGTTDPAPNPGDTGGTGLPPPAGPKAGTTPNTTESPSL